MALDPRGMQAQQDLGRHKTLVEDRQRMFLDLTDQILGIQQLVRSVRSELDYRHKMRGQRRQADKAASTVTLRVQATVHNPTMK